MTCGASFHQCHCGLDEHPVGTRHICRDPDPKCGGSWLDHPTDTLKALVVHYPGNRPGGVNAHRGVVDPSPDAPVEEYRGLPPRGRIRLMPVPSFLNYEGDAAP